MKDTITKLRFAIWRKPLLLVACSWSPYLAAAGEAGFLQRSDVVEVRGNMADVVVQIATAFETDPETQGQPWARAQMMLQLTEAMSKVLSNWEPKLTGDAQGEMFMADGLTVSTCIGLASIEDLDQQVAMLGVAADYWRMRSNEPVPSDLCN